MILFIQLAFVICLAMTVTRLAGKSKRPNLSILTAAVLTTLAVGLMVPPVYNMIDPIFGKTNMTDLIAKACLMVAVALFGGQCARAMNSKLALRLTTQMAGLAVLAVALLALFATFLAVPDEVRSPALQHYASLTSAKLNTGVVLAYIGYVVLANLKAVVGDARSNPVRTMRVSSAFLAAGFILALVRCLLFLVELKVPEIFSYAQIVSMVSTALVATGCAIAYSMARKTSKRTIYSQSLLSTDN